MTYRGTVALMFAFQATFLALTLLSFLFLTPGTPSYVIAQLTLIVLLVSLALFGFVLYREWNPESMFETNDDA